MYDQGVLVSVLISINNTIWFRIYSYFHLKTKNTNLKSSIWQSPMSAQMGVNLQNVQYLVTNSQLYKQENQLSFNPYLTSVAGFVKIAILSVASCLILLYKQHGINKHICALTKFLSIFWQHNVQVFIKLKKTEKIIHSFYDQYKDCLKNAKHISFIIIS